MPLDLLFLGTGTSAGVPMIGCHCEVCRSGDPRDNRTRPSVLISYDERTAGVPQAASPEPQASLRSLLVDTAPDMRVQMIREGIDRIDGVLYTHAHADHIFGLDDLRRFNAVMDSAIDVYVDEATRGSLQHMFRYIFESENNLNQSWVPRLVLHPLVVGEAVDLFGASWLPIRLMHGRQPVLGFRVDLPTGGGRRAESLAYCTDMSAIPAETLPNLRGLDVLVIDGLRYKEHPTHLSVDQALAIIDELKPGRAYLTHIAHDIMHADLEQRLPPGVYLSYDGLRVRWADGAEIRR